MIGKLICLFIPHKWWPWVVTPGWIYWRCIRCDEKCELTYSNSTKHLIEKFRSGTTAKGDEK